MKINCRSKWIEALSFFLNEGTLTQLHSLGLHVDRFDWRNQQVVLGADSDESLALAVEGVAAVGSQKQSSVWVTNIAMMLAGECGSKRKYLESVQRQIEKCGSNPTEAQLQIIRPMWKAYQRRQLEAIGA